MKYVIGNWKMNGSISLLAEFKNILTDGVILCVPAQILTEASKIIETGAEDCSAHEDGAFTGEISAKMIAETGAKYVIVGHSERRQYWNESSKLVSEKASMALKYGLTPIICVGETREQKESGKTLEIIENQVKESIPAEAKKIIVAYEPVWAIGTGLVPTTDDIKSVHAHIAEILKKMGLQHTAILYGGSVKASNAGEIMQIPHVGGVLVGGASLKRAEFDGIIAASGNGANNSKHEARNELDELKDKYVRTLAELENLRKRSSIDAENTARARAIYVTEQFLPLIDAIDAAAEHFPDDEGIKTLKKASDNSLAKLGIVRIETAGQILNPQFHNAISTEESKLPSNTIIREMQSGFMFGDSVLRSALVVVAK